jgi:molybdopterin-guanine dinucleotide biosynthesis protein A
LIDRVAAALRGAADDLLLVANDAGADTWLPGVRRVTDVRPGLGPLGGIHAALASTKGAVLVVAWDMPFVSPALLSALRRIALARHCAVVPESAPGRLEPTCALYAQSCRAELERWLDAGSRNAAALLGDCPCVRVLSVEEASVFGDPDRMFFSVNTVAALERAETLAVHS